MSSTASLSCYPQRAAFDLRAPAAALSPPPAVSSLDAAAAVTRSMHHPSPSQLPLAHKVAAGQNTTMTMPLAMPVYASPLKGPQHWRPHALAATSAISPSHKLASPLAQVIPPTVPYHSGLAASLLAHKHQNQAGVPSTATVTGTAPAAADISPSLCLPLMQRGESVPSSSGSTASFTSAFGSAAASPLPSPRHRNDSSLADEPPPCPISLWFGCEDATHARCVLAAYAAKLQLYTQQAPGCRAPLEFIGRVRRDRLDVAKLHRAVEQFHNKARQRASQRQPRQRYASAASPRFSGGLGRRPFASSPCMSSFSPSSSPCSSGLMAEPSALDRLPASGSFATLDLVSIYSRDTLPLGLAFPLIRHEWVCSVWNEEDGVAESCTRIHTEYEDDEPPADQQDGEEKRQNEDEDDEDVRAKRVLQLYAKSVQKMSKKASSTKGSPLTDSSTALQQDRDRGHHHQQPPHPHPFSLTASVTSAPSGSWHPATSAAPSQHSDQQPSAAAPASALLQSQQSAQGRSRSVSHTPSPPPTTAFLYCLPIFSEDCKNGSYDTFGCRVQRDTDATLSSTRAGANGDKAGARAALPSVSQAGSVATVGDHSLGYAGAQNSCIYECMKTLGRKIAGGSNAGLGVGNGGDDSTGEANCAQTVVDHEMEMRAIAAALTKMHQQQQQASIGDSATAAVASATTTADGDLSSESSQSRSCSREDDLDSIGEDVMFSSGATPGAEATGFEFGAPDDEESSGSESDSDSDSDSDSSDSDSDAPQRTKRNVSGSKAVVIKGAAAAASRRSHGVAATDDDDLSDDDDDVSSSCASSYARSFGGSGSMAAGSLGDELAAQLMALNGGRATASKKPAAKGRK